MPGPGNEHHPVAAPESAQAERTRAVAHGGHRTGGRERGRRPWSSAGRRHQGREPRNHWTRSTIRHRVLPPASLPPFTRCPEETLTRLAALSMNSTCAQPALTSDEVRVLKNAAAHFSLRDQVILEISLMSGLRISSILAANCGHFFCGGQVRREFIVPRKSQKGGQGARRRAVKTRVVPLPETLREKVKLLLQLRFPEGEPAASAPLFISREGTPLSRRQATHVLKQMFTAAGICDRVGFGWHGCRRWFALTLYNDVTGHDLVVTSQLLFHASISNTVIYLGLNSAAIGDGYRGVADRLAGMVKTETPRCAVVARAS